MIEYVDRKGTNSMKWDGLNATFGTDGLLPLWVADMDFKVDQHILDAMRSYVDAGVFGYYQAPDSYYQAFIDWEHSEHNVEIQRDWIRFSPGVVVGFHAAVQALTDPGDAVLIHTPVYYPFIDAVEGNKRTLVKAPLANTNGSYTIDFDAFERLIVEHHIKAYLFCSPHNPVGRAWTPEEIDRILEICRQHNVAIISDEIHQDLVFGPHKHTSIFTRSLPTDQILMLTAASKTFNIAALQNAFVVMPNPHVQERWDNLMQGLRLRAGNALGYIGVEAAYTHGKPWLQEVMQIIEGNYQFMVNEFAQALPEVVVSPLEGTYLAWADFSAYLEPDQVEPFMQNTCKLAFDYGQWFGNESDKSFIRINLATRRENIAEMCTRIISKL